MLENIRKKITALIPGSAPNIAAAKRRFELDMRAAGHSRKEATRLASEHFTKPLREPQK